MCSPTWWLSEACCSRVFIELNLQLPSSSWRLEDGAENFNCLIIWSFWWPTLSRGSTLSYLINMKRCDQNGLIIKNKRHPYHSGNFKGLRNSVPGLGTKAKYIFLLYHSRIYRSRAQKKRKSQDWAFSNFGIGDSLPCLLNSVDTIGGLWLPPLSSALACQLLFQFTVPQTSTWDRAQVFSGVQILEVYC